MFYLSFDLKEKTFFYIIFFGVGTFSDSKVGKTGSISIVEMHYHIYLKYSELQLLTICVIKFK